MSAQYDPEHHLTPAEIAAIRGPFLARPSHPEPREWLRWAKEVADAAPLAKRLLDAQALKEALPKKGSTPPALKYMSQVSVGNPPERFTYSRARDAWRVNEIEYPSGMSGCVMKALRNGEWLILQDPRQGHDRPTFRTRDEAALAEWHLAEQAKTECKRTIETWARSGISIEQIDRYRWKWTRVSDGTEQIAPTEFMDFECCVADLNATMNSAASDPRVQALAEKALLESLSKQSRLGAFFYAKVRVPSIWKHYADWAAGELRSAEAHTA